MSGRGRRQAGRQRCTGAFCLLLAALSLGPANLAQAGTPAAATTFSARSATEPQLPTRTALAGQPPPPGDLIVSQVHNAPGWLPSHAYAYATGPYTRVVNGPGWVASARVYHPGQPLNAYQLVSSAACASGTDGGPRGTGPVIKDGTCTWKYLSPVDYISVTGWAFDNRPWKGGTLYHYRDYVTSDAPLRAYTLLDENCASNVAPAGPGDAKSTVTTGDGCHWQYQADIIYSSKRSYIPTETSTSSRSPTVLMLKANYEAQLWNDREYIAGQNGEASPIRTQDHNDYRHEGGVVQGCTSAPCPHLIITAAPGESFRDSLGPSDPLRGYDPRKGVSIRNTQPYRWPNEPAGIDVHDNYVDIVGLQIKSLHGAAVNGKSSFGNDMTIRDCILEGGSDDRWTSHAAVTLDTSSVVANSVVIAHGPIGIDFKYPGYALHDTVVNAGPVANTVGITTWHDWVFNGQTVSNTAIFGFAHAVASTAELTAKGPGVTWLGGHNVTDASASDTAANTPGGKVYKLPRTVYGASAVDAFAAPGRDWRVKSGGPLSGKGSAFGTFSLYCATGGPRPQPNCPRRVDYAFDTPDIAGTKRPQAGRYDIGAWQSCALAGGERCPPEPQRRVKQ